MSPDVNNLSENRLRAILAELESLDRKGELTPNQARRMSEVKDALDAIRRARKQF